MATTLVHPREQVEAKEARITFDGPDLVDVGATGLFSELFRGLQEQVVKIFKQRDVFLLYEETGLGLEDIGRITGVAMETAKSRLRYALGKLRGALRQHQSPSLQSSVSS